MGPPMPHPHRVILVLPLLMALTLVACGGDDDDGTGSGPLTRAEYAERTGQLDAVTDPQVDAVNATVDQQLDPAESNEDAFAAFAEFGNAFVRIVTKATDDLEELEPPAALRADHDATVANLRRRIEIAQALADAAEKEDLDAILDVVPDLDLVVEEARAQISAEYQLILPGLFDLDTDGE